LIPVGGDNAGNILRIDISDVSAENIARISNSDLRDSSTGSLAISNVDPGTSVVVTAMPIAMPSAVAEISVKARIR